MKKVIIVLLLLVSVLYYKVDDNSKLIPSDAIRFRVVANSDSEQDQKIKKLVSHELQKQISLKLQDVSNSEEARFVLKNNVPSFQETVFNTLKLNNIEETFSVNYGMNHFPEKTYNGVTYDEGDYESLVVTLGEGLGKNWWCVLFPPLCLLEAEEVEGEEVEYTFFIKELIDKIFK